jgi:hypothetical protein
MYGNKDAELEAEQEAADKLAAFDNDEWTRNVISGRDPLAKSGKAIYNGANPDDVELLVALIDQRHEFPSVTAFRAAYAEAEDRVVSDNLKFHRLKANDAELTLAKSAAELAQVNLAKSVAEARAQGVNVNEQS